MLARLPVDSVPIELLSYIFSLAAQTEEHICSHTTYDPLVTVSGIVTPLHLASVCRRWRVVALSTATLWTTVSISLADVVQYRGSSFLDLNHLYGFLRLSKNSLLDVIIDARESGWDYSEEGVTGCGLRPYTPPFNDPQMRTALKLLAQHVARWRSLTILTDTYAPMSAALEELSLLPSAPRLESLTLKRNNPFHSYATFQPVSLKDDSWVPFGAGSSSLPMLKSLNLIGVHLDWTELPHLLPLTLASLELSYHSYDVRPSVSQFRGILEKCTELRSLAINNSGPCYPFPMTENIGHPITLPLLRTFTLGFTSTEQTALLLHSLISAPGVEHFTLEDNSHPCDEDDDDACYLLEYLGNNGADHLNAALGVKPRIPSPTSTPPPPEEETKSSLPPSFPKLTSLTLNKISTKSISSYQALLTPHTHLHTLTLYRPPLEALLALIPCPKSPNPAPAPALETLIIHTKDNAEFTQTQESIILNRTKPIPNIVCIPIPESEVEEWDDEEDDPFALGGAFNDPLFDTRYGTGVVG